MTAPPCLPVAPVTRMVFCEADILFLEYGWFGDEEERSLFTVNYLRWILMVMGIIDIEDLPGC